MPENYILLERTELNASAASVTFANIPQTGYTDLKIVVSARTTTTGTAANIAFSFNGSTTSRTNIYLGGNGSAASSGTSGELLIWALPYNDATANTFGNTELYIPNYTSSNYKSMSTDGVSENNATDGRVAFNASLWSNTAAINSITLTPQAGSLMQYSTFSLYGLAATGTTPAIAPKASGGNIIDYDGTYWIHTFTSSGTFTPQTGLTCDYLVVAGGGGSGGSYAGGGAGGGFRSTVTATGGGGSLESALAVVSGTAYTVTVGAGGNGGALNSVGTNGSDSVFSTITSTGGGGGGGFNSSLSAQYTGANGGSGGGGGNSADGVTANGGTRVTGQGFAGGTGAYNSTSGGKRTAGGGGGAGAVGANGIPIGGFGGNGGAGVASSISGSSVTRAGGGGGAGETVQGTGGSGGGGTNTTGTVNTGGGGSMGYTNTTGNAGGSGVVIIRYLA